jgi:hypothetical protein
MVGIRYASRRILNNDIQSEFPGYRISDLSRMGFEFAGYLAKTPKGRDTITRLAMFVHPGNKDSAELIRIVGRRITIDLLVFKARFDDGFSFETSDSRTPRIPWAVAQFPIFNFAQVGSTTDLYRIEGSRSALQPNANRSLPTSEGSLQNSWRGQRPCIGGIWNTETGDRYIYTLKGAIRAAWRLVWPSKPILEMRARSSALEEARLLGLRINPKSGRIIG